MKKVLIIYKFMPQYRIEFFNGLKTALEHNDIVLTVVYGKLKNNGSLKKDEVDLPWAIYRENKVFSIGSTSLVWQPVSDLIKEQDLVIVEQANSLLINYILMLLRRFTKTKLAFWGHGANLQESGNSLKNRFKYLYLKECDWWFAYTKGVKAFLENKNVDSKKITVVQNAIDTKKLIESYKNITDQEVEHFKRQHKISSYHIGIYCGALYPEKRIDFLIEAAIKIREQIKDFELFIIGAGEDSYLAETAASLHDWIHYEGPKFGQDRIIYFKLASLFLIPGAVGLAILDSFALETPMITVKNAFHGPEIGYLQNGVNGYITENQLELYVDKIVHCFQYPDMIETMSKECQKSANQYTVEAMIDNFAKGVYKCLA